MWYLVETRNRASKLTPVPLDAWRAFVEASPGIRLCTADWEGKNPFTGEPIAMKNHGGDAEVQAQKGADYERVFEWSPPGRLRFATLTEGRKTSDPAYKLAKKFADSIGGKVVESDGEDDEEFAEPRPPRSKASPATRRLLKAANVVDAAGVIAALADGADVHALDKDGFTALHRCVDEPDLVRALLEAGAAPDAAEAETGIRPLHLVGSAESIRLLLAAGADLEGRRGDGCTPLHCAAESSQLDAMQALLDAGADLEARDYELGRTPLHAAAGGARYASGPTEERMAALRFVLRAGADATARDHEGQTFLSYAESSIRGSRPGPEWFAFLRELTDLGALDRPRALVEAAERGDMARVRALLAEGVDADSRADLLQRSQVTPLYAAAGAGHAEVVEAFLAAGAVVDPKGIRDYQVEPNVPLGGRTPLDAAALRGHEAVVRILLAAGADPKGKFPPFVPSLPTRARAAGHAVIADLLAAAAG